MTLTAEDRVALILGRAIHRAEALQVQVEALEAELADLRATLESPSQDKEKT